MFFSCKSKFPTIIVTLFLLVFLSSITIVQAAQLTWTVQTVDAAADVGKYTSLAIDSAGNLHVSYWDQNWNDLKYAKLTGSTWTIVPVDTVGDIAYLGTAIDVDSANNPHISYYDYTNGDLKYAQWTGSSWNIQTIDSIGNVGPYSSLALDSNNRAHISYQDYTNGKLKYAHWTGSTWDIQTVEPAGSSGSASSLAIDTNNRPHIAYYQLNYPISNLKYARWTGSTWNFETIESGDNKIGALGVSLTLDSSNNPHISYYENTNNDLKYAKKTGSTWNTETVDASQNVGSLSSIALDSTGYPHIAYYDNYWDDLKYAKLTDYGWLIKNVDNIGNVGNYPSLVLDSSNHPHIVYRDETNQNLKYARNPNESFKSWDFNTSDSDGDSNNDLVEFTCDVDTTFTGSLSVYVYAELKQDTGPVWASNYTSISITSTQSDSTTLTLMLPQDAPPGPYVLYVWLEDDGATIEGALLFDAGTLYPPQSSQVGYLTGTVTDLDTSLPLEGSEIYVDDPSASTVQAVTNATGQYWIQLTEGDHEITVTGSESSLYFYESANVTIVHDTITTQDFQLQRSNWILFVYVVGSGVTETDPPSSNTFPVDSWVQVEAFPDSEWILDYWILDSVNAGSENPLSVLMDSDHNLTAVFTEGEPPGDEYDLTVTVTGSGSTSPSAGVYSYNEGTSVSITASAASGWTFNHWLLDSANVGNENPYSLTMDADHTLTAVFTEVSGGENQRPYAILSVNSTTINVNEAVLCNGGESYDSDGQIMLYFFDFGDETNTGWITSSNVSHRYSTLGEYTISLRVEDNQGLISSSQSTLSVTLNVIPEFTSLIIIPFLVTTTLMIIIFKRRMNKQKQ